MLFPYRQIGQKVRWHSRRALLAVVGGGLMALGGGFLVAAAWMVLAEQFSPLLATLACGAIFVGAGLIVLVLRGSDPEPEIPSMEEHLHKEKAAGKSLHLRGDFPALMEAFLFGVSIYTDLTKRKR